MIYNGQLDNLKAYLRGTILLVSSLFGSENQYICTSGELEALKEMARKMRFNGLDQQSIMDAKGLNTDELAQLSL